MGYRAFFRSNDGSESSLPTRLGGAEDMGDPNGDCCINELNDSELNFLRYSDIPQNNYICVEAQ